MFSYMNLFYLVYIETHTYFWKCTNIYTYLYEYMMANNTQVFFPPFIPLLCSLSLLSLRHTKLTPLH